MAAEKGIEVDEAGFEAAHGRTADAVSQSGQACVCIARSATTPAAKHSEFVGYETLTAHSRVVAYQPARDGLLDLYLDITPFYAESGGQVGDRGTLTGDGTRFDVATTFKDGEAIVHRGRLCDGPSRSPHGPARDGIRRCRNRA